ncbi:small acid-soluble spore protein P [Insulibacter thermoxylanivorax]|nr:small acid-soluble spore protein P [Insulibacter thermoxylanivorax]
MPKTKSFPVFHENRKRDDHETTVQEPLSGSKKVKSRNHSRQNHGEGS